ncbi:MAG: hypothetical protein Q7S21_03200 [archaeon]|nr:hypothetical protein [archaeon]
MHKAFIVIIAFIFLFSFVSAATLSGTVYEWFSFQPLDNTVIEVNSSPNQTIVSQNGEYSFQLAKGKYVIHAEYSERGRVLYVADENVNIIGDGNFVLDLIMFPSTDFNESDLPPIIEEFDENDLLVQNQKENEKLFPLIALIVVIIIILVLVYFLLVKQKKKESLLPVPMQKEELVEVKQQIPVVSPVQNISEQVDKTAQGVLDVLKRYGGRMNQKDLREKTDIGEAKLSLIVAELESMQLIKKIKKGRGNIVVLLEK